MFLVRVGFEVEGEGCVVVMESACRIGGDFISELVHRQHGVDLERTLVRIRLGRPAAAPPGEGAQPGCVHGIRFLFGDSTQQGIPAPVTLLREVTYRRASQPTRGFGIHQRTGYQILRSPCAEALRAYLSTDCKPAEQTAAMLGPHFPIEKTPCMANP